jgi:prepilin-type N-terminal cleavage/methylation domain-containing protein
MERQKMKKKGFTLVELLVVIAIIAMLLAILMPALGKVRQLAQRIMCGTNLTGIGKAMLTYSTDDKYESFPISAIAGTIWDRGTGGAGGVCSTWDWRNPNVYATVSSAIFEKATVSSCLYLVIKYADVAPDQFICPGSDLKKFELSKYNLGNYKDKVSGFADVWDFGSYATASPQSSRGKGHNSYCYQFPLPITGGASRPVTTTTNPAMAVMADRNPFWQFDVTKTTAPKTVGEVYIWDGPPNNKVVATSIPGGNATYHQKDGQNVLYADQHSKFERSANCGVESDNIYTTWGVATIVPGSADEAFRQCGQITKPAQTGVYYPMNEFDNYLVCDMDKTD